MQTFTVEEIKVYYNANITIYTPGVNNTLDATIFREIEVLGIEPTNGDIAVEQYTNTMMTVTIDNPEGYTIESININGTVYPNTDFISASTTAVVLNIPVNYGGNEGRVEEFEVRAVVFSDGEAVRVLEKYDRVLSVTGLFIYENLVINHISTVEDLQNIEEYGYYVLDNDIDLSGINWDPIEEFRGYLDGRGYVIRNLTIAEITNNDEHRRFGLFEFHDGYITNLGIEGLNINIMALHEGSYDYFVGGIAGYSRGIITNSYVIGKIEVNNVLSLIVGGLVGYSSRSVIEESYSKGEIVAHTRNQVSAGGIVGNGYTISIKNVYSEMDITFSSGQNFNIGGILGNTWGRSEISNAYYIGEITREGNEGWGRVGGIVAELSEGTIHNVYTENYLIVDYTYNVTVKNAYVLNPTNFIQNGDEYHESMIDITEITSLSDIDFEVDLGMNSGVWDFSGDYPTLLSVDNTPIYTTE